VLRLIKLLFSLVCIAIFVWFGATVPLGNRTLFGHLHALWTSPEGRDLEQGVSEKAHETTQAVRRDLTGSDASPASAPTASRH
jgi:hypothetical protein